MQGQYSNSGDLERQFPRGISLFRGGKMKGRLFGKPFSAGNFLTTSFDSIPRFFFRLRTLRIKKKNSQFTISSSLLRTYTINVHRLATWLTRSYSFRIIRASQRCRSIKSVCIPMRTSPQRNSDTSSRRRRLPTVGILLEGSEIPGPPRWLN